MKKFIALLIITMLCLCGLFSSIPVSAVDVTYDWFVANGSDHYVNIRTTANGSIVVSVPNGSLLYVPDYDGGTGWYTVTYKQSNGNLTYAGVVHSSCLVYYYSYSPEETNSEAVMVTTNSSNLNVRSAPNISANIVTTIPKGTVITEVFDYNSSWARVTYNGQTGYCSSQYLSTPTIYSNSSSTLQLYDAYDYNNTYYYTSGGNVNRTSVQYSTSTTYLKGIEKLSTTLN